MIRKSIRDLLPLITRLGRLAYEHEETVDAAKRAVMAAEMKRLEHEIESRAAGILIEAGVPVN